MRACSPHDREARAAERVEQRAQDGARAALAARAAVVGEGEAREVEAEDDEELEDPLADGLGRDGRDEVERVEEDVEGGGDVGAVARAPLPQRHLEPSAG